MRSILRGILAGLLVTVGAVQAAEGVLVSGATQGQGTLRARSGECFAITPQHVVGLGGCGAHRHQCRTCSGTGAASWRLR